MRIHLQLRGPERLNPRPEVLAWLRECERILSEVAMRVRFELMMFGRAEFPKSVVLPARPEGMGKVVLVDTGVDLDALAAMLARPNELLRGK